MPHSKPLYSLVSVSVDISCRGFSNLVPLLKALYGNASWYVDLLTFIIHWYTKELLFVHVVSSLEESPSFPEWCRHLLCDPRTLRHATHVISVPLIRRLWIRNVVYKPYCQTKNRSRRWVLLKKICLHFMTKTRENNIIPLIKWESIACIGCIGT